MLLIITICFGKQIRKYLMYIDPNSHYQLIGQSYKSNVASNRNLIVHFVKEKGADSGWQPRICQV